MEFKDFIGSGFSEINIGLVLLIALSFFAGSFIPFFNVDGSNVVFLYFFMLCFFFSLLVLNIVFRFYRSLLEKKVIVLGLLFCVFALSIGFAYHEQIVFDRDLALRRNLGLEYYNSVVPKRDICYVQKNYLSAFSATDRLKLQTELFDNMLSKGYALRTETRDYFIFKKSAVNKEQSYG